MQTTITVRLLLALSSLIAVFIGSSILFTPADFHASNGIELAADASLFSEVRAPGGALLALGALMLVGAFARAFTFASMSIAAAVYLAYGLSRMVSIGLDGVPASGLIAAMAVELAIGLACAGLLVRAMHGARVSDARSVAGTRVGGLA